MKKVYKINPPNPEPVRGDDITEDCTLKLGIEVAQEIKKEFCDMCLFLSGLIIGFFKGKK